MMLEVANKNGVLEGCVYDADGGRIVESVRRLCL
jgi:hypothetical protein